MAPAEDDISIEEKRVYAGTAGRTDAYVATESGVVRVGAVGRQDRRVRHGRPRARPRRGGPSAARRPGPARRRDPGRAPGRARRRRPRVRARRRRPVGSKSLVAVGVHDDAFLVAGEDGEINGIEFGDEESDPTATSIGTVSRPARSRRPPRRGRGRGLSSLRRRFRTRLGRPRRRPRRGRIRNALDRRGRRAYWLGNGWMTALEGDATAVAADGDGHAMAVVDGDLFVHADDDTEVGRRGVDRGGPPGRRGTGRARLRSRRVGRGHRRWHPLCRRR